MSKVIKRRGPRKYKDLGETPPPVISYIKKHYKRKTHAQIARLLNKMFPRAEENGPWNAKHISSICRRKKWKKIFVKYGKMPPEALEYIRLNWQEESDRQLVISLGKLIKDKYGNDYAQKIILTKSRINNIRTRSGWSEKIKPKVSAPPAMVKFIKETIAEMSRKEQAYLCNRRWPRGKGNGIWNGMLITAICTRFKLPKRTSKQRREQTARLRKSGLYRPNLNPNPLLKPIGHTRVVYVPGAAGKKRPVTYVKTETGFRQNYIVMWEQHYGLVPEGLIIFPMDGDWNNIVIENLYLRRNDFLKKATEDLTDNYIIGKLSGGDKDLAKALRETTEGQEIVEAHRGYLELNRHPVKKSGNQKKKHHGAAL